MPLPVLKDLLEDLKKESKLIQERDPQLSASVIIKLRQAFPSMEFHRDHVAEKTPEDLSVIFPYQWFLLACAAVPFYKALIEYRKIAVDAAVDAGGADHMKLIKKARPRPAKLGRPKQLGRISQDFKNSIASLLGGNEGEVKKVVTFLKKYKTWGGRKGIERGQKDFHVSPILNSLGLLAASSNYVVHLCEKLVDNEKLAVNPSVLAILNPYFAFEGGSHVSIGNLTRDFVDSLKGCGFYSGGD